MRYSRPGGGQHDHWVTCCCTVPRPNNGTVQYRTYPAGCNNLVDGCTAPGARPLLLHCCTVQCCNWHTVRTHAQDLVGWCGPIANHGTWQSSWPPAVDKKHPVRQEQTFHFHFCQLASSVSVVFASFALVAFVFSLTQVFPQWPLVPQPPS